MRGKTGGRGGSGPDDAGAAPRPQAGADQGGVVYELEFKPAALREWDRLDGSLQEVFLRQLEKRLRQPRVGPPLRGTPNRYKIKLHGVGYRLVYDVEDDRLVVLVLTVGRRDGGVYDRVSER